MTDMLFSITVSGHRPFLLLSFSYAI